jgi:hypothetical protein
MSRQGQKFRAVKDDVTNPTLFKVIQSQTFLQDESVLSNIDGFINNHPLNASSTELTSTTITGYNGINPTVLSQLNRLQRSLRGLPPLFEDEQTPSLTNTIQPTNNETATNKKIVFDE